MSDQAMTGGAGACQGVAVRRLALLGLGAILATGLPAPAARAAVPDQPAATAPPTAQHLVGKKIFTELVTPDLAAARSFYAALFGWSFQDVPTATGIMTLASSGGAVVAGLVQRPMPAARRPAWLAFLSTDDVDRFDALALRNGATLLAGPQPLGGLGREAVLADPQGAVFAVLQSAANDEADVLPEPGQWIWGSLITTDPAAAAGFYKAAFGYEVDPLPDAQDAQHLILASQDFARASVNPVPASWKGAHPRWLSYVRVADTAVAAARVAALGGHVVLPPRVDRHGGRIAVVADPQGALFGLMEWSDDAPAGDTK